MQINVALSKDSKNQAETLRETLYPNSNSQQTRDGFIFNQCIDMFMDAPEILIPIIKKEDCETAQRMITVKAESYERLKTISAAINRSAAATFRAIIVYTIENLPDKKKDSSPSAQYAKIQLISEKTALLERQLSDANKTLNEIKLLLKE